VTAAHQFAEWAMSLRPEDIPADVAAAAKRHILDGIGCALAAARLKEVPYAAGIARSMGDSDEASVLGEGIRGSEPAAAFANGVLIHALDFDDTHTGALVHATAATLPAALAVGESKESSGSEVLAACVAGYELVIRLGAAVTHGFHSKGFHATSACGVFASALIAARLMRLGIVETVNALGIAGSAAAGSLEFLNTGASTKQIHPGLSGMNGVLSARLASEGASGPDSIFEGEYGLFRSYTGTEVASEALTEGLGSSWETTNITIKPYPACQLFHTNLSALESIRNEIGDVDAVQSVTFDVPSDSVPIVCEPADAKLAPRTSYEGKFSLPFSAASLLIKGELGVDSFGAGRLSDPRTLEMARRVGYRTTHPEGAPADVPGRVVAQLTDGRLLEGRAEKFEPAEEQVEAKFRSNCGGNFPADDLIKLVGRLEELDDLSELLAATVPAAALH
jgi:2-methylcitrate dehydratase PrpD